MSFTWKYRTMAVNRPMVIRRGWEGEIESNMMRGYVGEWVVFQLPLESGAIAELRMPVEDALDEGMIIAADKINYTPADFEEYDGDDD